MQKFGWRGFLFEHVSRQWIVDNPTTYVHVLAEGVTKLARRLSIEAGRPLDIKILAAHRSLPKDEARKEFVRMSPDLYESRLRERLDFERVRSPHYAHELGWTWSFTFSSATQIPRLMLADVICYGWRRQADIAAPGRAAVSSLLRDQVYHVLQVSDIERIQTLLSREDHGLALLDLLFLLVNSQKDDTVLEECQNDMLTRLSYLGDSFLDAALEWPLNRIEAELERRSLEQTERLVKAFLGGILEPLRARVEPEAARRLAWAEAQALSLALAGCNHRGALRKAEGYLSRMTETRTILWSQYERMPLSLAISFNEAVHWSNSYDFGRAHKAMSHLDTQMGEIVSLLGDVIAPTHGEIRSDAVGKAFGTALQAAIAMGRRTPSMYAKARELSDIALNQFERSQDRKRQAGYRCQLETEAGTLVEALAWLSRSLESEEELTLEEIINLGAADGVGFTLMHLARLWEATARAGHREKARSFEHAWRHAGLESDDRWNKPGGHPLPLVLWKWGSALGYSGRLDQGEELVERAIQFLEKSSDNVTLATLALGARCDKQAILCESVGTVHTRYKKGMRRVREVVQDLTAISQLPSIRAYFVTWHDRIALLETISKPDAAQKLWRELAWDVPY